MCNHLLKKCFIGLSCLSTLTYTFAQQQPHYTQYVLNQFILNPALAGIENYTDVKFSHRLQWVGMKDAPVTSYFTIHTALGKKDYRTTATSFAMNGKNPRGKDYWDEYHAADPHHGIGLQIINDKTGPLSHLSAYANYAYHMGLSARTNLSGGFGIGFTRISLDASQLDIFNTSLDPAVLQNGLINRFTPDLNAGLYLYAANYFIGISAKQIIPQKVNFSNNTLKKEDGKLIPHLFISAGYRFLSGEDFNVIPSLMIKYLPYLPMQVDLNTKVQYKNIAWIGAGYRYAEGFNGLLGCNISNLFNATYSYDYTTSNLNHYTKGTHEIVIGFILGNGYGDACPKNVW